VRDCRDQPEASGRSYAYTTIQTVFDALHKKRMVSRRRTKTAYRYTAASSRASLFADGLRELVSRLKMAPEPVASCLVEALEEGEGERLRALISELRSRGHLAD
jgi:predicted transcriptional regulator